MNLLSIENVSKNYGEKQLFDRISFGIDQGEKIGLLGVNGTGKTTFLKVIAGIEAPDQGRVTVGNKVSLEYLPQNPHFDNEANVLQQIFRGRPPLDDQKEFWETESDAKIILTKLGIVDFEAKLGTLSGGQRKRVALATALINPADLLILDEPTNHIDNQTVDWLEQYLNKRKGALLMVTHDRYFLDRVVNGIIELDEGKLYSYAGNYSQFLELKALREEQLQSSEKKRLNLYRNELAWIRRGAKARSTKQKARIDRFEQIKEEKLVAESERIELPVGVTPLGKKVIELEQVCKQFDGNKLISNLSYIIARDDRIGIVGPNGVGKTTLLKLLIGNLAPDSGTIDIGPTVKIGYFAQEYGEMNENLRVINYIKEEAEVIPTSGGGTISASQLLDRFLFPSALQWTPIAKLSGGERRRLYLLRILMSAPNVLLLDEPTNDLDIQTLTILEGYLDDFNGAVIAVSHDRYFLDRVTDKIFSFEGGGIITKHLGNYSQYLETNLQSSEDLEHKKAKTIEPKQKSLATLKTAPLKFSFNEQREFEQIETFIDDLEQELRAVKEKLIGASANFVLLQDLLAQEASLEQELDKKLERWAYLNEIAEQIAERKK